MGCCNSYPLSNFSRRYKKISSEDQFLISYTDSIVFSSFDFHELYVKLAKFSEVKISQEDLESFFSDANIEPSLLKINSSTAAILQKIYKNSLYDLKSLKLTVILLGKGNYYDKCLKIFEVYDLCLKLSYLDKRTLLLILYDLVGIIEMIIPENGLDDSPDIVKSCIKDYCVRFLDEKLRVFDKIIKLVFKNEKEILCSQFLRMLEINHSLCSLFNANSLRLLLIDEVISHETSTLFQEMYPKIGDSPVYQKSLRPTFNNPKIEGKILLKPVKNYSIQIQNPVSNPKSIFETDWEKKFPEIPKINLNLPEAKPVALSDCDQDSSESMSGESCDMNSSFLGFPKPQSRVRSSSSTEDLAGLQLIPQIKRRGGILKRCSTDKKRSKKKSSIKSVSFSVESIGNKKQSALEPIILRVNLGENKFENVQLKPGENPAVAASAFAIKNRLKKYERDELARSLRSLIED
ncbi:unnamed protein product [Blepharisma stoltei]|uniref:Uncharacterized protein n=1 Tax=Blepharisma stoltei TaxID=1481888 RepID=A0AAU9J604_9CILI|nr:unnamed protein product [Blepharisma stoltei]